MGCSVPGAASTTQILHLSGSGNIMEDRGERFYKPEAQDIWCEIVFPGNYNEVTPLIPGQYGCLAQT